MGASGASATSPPLGSSSANPLTRLQNDERYVARESCWASGTDWRRRYCTTAARDVSTRFVVRAYGTLTACAAAKRASWFFNSSR